MEFKIGHRISVSDPEVRKGVIINKRRIGGQFKYDILFDGIIEENGREKLKIFRVYNVDEKEIHLHEDEMWLTIGDVIKVLEKDHDAIFINRDGEELKIKDHQITLACKNFQRRWKRKED